MPKTARLEALHRPDETLRPHFSLRPHVEIPSGCHAGNEICLGRNSTTQVAHPTIHRRACHVYWAIPTRDLIVRGCKPESKFYLNGALIEGKQALVLSTGDRIALGKNEESMEYEYKVVIESDGNNNATSHPTAARLSRFSVNSARRSTPGSGRKRKARTADPPASLVQFPVESAAPVAAAAASNTTDNAAQQAAAEECLCAMCLEIQVQSTTLVPCGHSFCHGCAQTTTECPTCRSNIQTRVHCRALDNVIAALVQTELFQPDDVQHYQERTAANQPKPSTTVKRRKRCREVSASSIIPETATNNNNSTGASSDAAICID